MISWVLGNTEHLRVVLEEALPLALGQIGAGVGGHRVFQLPPGIDIGAFIEVFHQPLDDTYLLIALHGGLLWQSSASLQRHAGRFEGETRPVLLSRHQQMPMNVAGRHRRQASLCAQPNTVINDAS